MPAARKKKETSLSIINRLKAPRKAMPSPGDTDLRRWYMHDSLGLTEEQIAKRENTSVPIVQASLEYVKEWKFRNSSAFLDTKFIEIITDQLDDVALVYQRGMKATKVVHIDRETGKITSKPDMAMQLKTATEIRSAIETIHPKGPLIQNNQQNNFGSSGGGYGGGMSFEAILRKKREEKGLINSQEAQLIEAELTHEESIADEFKDFGGSGDDDDNEDEEEGE